MALRKPDPLVVDSGASAPPSTRAVVPVPPGVLTVVRRLSRAWLLVAVGVFLALAGTVGIPRSPEGDGLAANVERPIQLMLLGLAAVAWLLAWRWEGAAAVLLALTGTALGLLAALAHRPLVSALVCVAFLVPAAGFWFGWQHRRSRRAVTAVAVVTIVLLGGTCFGASAVYAHFFGPAHPVSSQPALPVDRVVWSWSGAMTTSSAIVVAQLTPGSRQARLVVEPESGGPTVVTRYADPVGAAVVRLAVDGLAPGTGYRYAIEIDGTADGGRGVGRLRTMPLGPASFTVAVGACAGTASNGAVFDAIANTRPLLYIQAGDLHYGNPDRNDINAFGALYRRALTAPAQAALYRSVPVAYGWDDHDYGPNDADATAATRPAARAAYRRYAPHADLPDVDGAICQAFSVGRVRFLMTDTRSERTGHSLLGARQLAWLQRELVAASRSHALVVWVNPDPWVAAAKPGADNWGGYPQERRQLADVIAAANIRNLVMLAGDAHMVAIDNGTNTDYSTAGHPGFPLLHAGALDRPGSVKGGPYSEGAFPGAGQFGTLTVTDDGSATITVELAGRTWRGDELVSYRTPIAVAPQ